MNKKEMNNVDELLDQILEKRGKPDYGRGLRRIAGMKCMNQKELAIHLGVTNQQVSKMINKPNWTDEQKQKVAAAFDMEVEGLDFISAESDLLGFVITNNTQGDGGIIGQNNFHNTYHFSNGDKVEDIITQLADTTKNLALLLCKLDEKIDEEKSKK